MLFCRDSYFQSVEEKFLWQRSFDVGSHQSDLELEECDFATVVGVKPVKHFLQEKVLLLL